MANFVTVKKSRATFMCMIVMFICVSFPGAHAQQIDMKYIELANNKVVFHYNLLDSIQGRKFSVRLYSSKDNFLNPLTELTGDFGLEVAPGMDRKIEWDAFAELGNQTVENISTSISVEIRARVFIPFINLDQINQYKVFKRRRKYNLTWSGGHVNNVMNFDLYKDGEKVTTFPNIANVGHHTFEFETFVKPGNGYRLKISDTKNKDEVVYSNPFRLKRRFPLLLKALPVIFVAGAVYMLTNKHSEAPIPLPVAHPN